MKPTNPAAYRERLELLAAACDTDTFAHLPVVSRDNAKPFAADLRSALADLQRYQVALFRMAQQIGHCSRVECVDFTSPDCHCAEQVRAALNPTQQETDRG